MEIQCEEEEESLCHCWLVTASPAGSSWSWLMELSAGPRRGRAGLFSHSLKPPFICPQQMGPPGPPARLRLPCRMRPASFILISEQVPERSHLTYRWPLRLVHLHKVTRYSENNGSLLWYCQVETVGCLHTFHFCPRSAGGRTGTLTERNLIFEWDVMMLLNKDYKHLPSQPLKYEYFLLLSFFISLGIYSLWVLVCWSKTSVWKCHLDSGNLSFLAIFLQCMDKILVNLTVGKHRSNIYMQE